MAETRKYVPIKEVISDRLTFLPLGIPTYVNSENIGLNLPATQRLMRVGGIRSLTLKANCDDRTTYEAEVVGYDEDRKAYAGAVLKKEKPLFNASVTASGEHDLPHPARWIDATIVVNTGEIADRISRDHDIRSASAWSSFLNKSIKGGLVETGINHLIAGLNSTDIFQTVLAYSGSTYLFLAENLADRPFSGAAHFVGFHVFFNMYNRYIRIPQFNKYEDYNGDGYHMSLLTGPQFDRAAVLYVMGKTSTLVKEIPKSDGPAE